MTCMQLRPLAALLASGHKIVLRKDMSYEWTCLSGLNVFQDDMSYESILCRRKCFVVGHENSLMR